MKLKTIPYTPGEAAMAFSYSPDPVPHPVREADDELVLAGRGGAITHAGDLPSFCP